LGFGYAVNRQAEVGSFGLLGWDLLLDDGFFLGAIVGEREVIIFLPGVIELNGLSYKLPHSSDLNIREIVSANQRIPGSAALRLRSSVPSGPGRPGLK
jgi:hypothetical protein